VITVGCDYLAFVFMLTIVLYTHPPVLVLQMMVPPKSLPACPAVTAWSQTHAVPRSQWSPIAARFLRILVSCSGSLRVVTHLNPGRGLGGTAYRGRSKHSSQSQGQAFESARGREREPAALWSRQYPRRNSLGKFMIGSKGHCPSPTRDTTVYRGCPFCGQRS
jgi:hypothetical protein